MESLNQPESNMATAAKALTFFKGEDDDDILAWIREVEFFGIVADIMLPKLTKMVLMHLRGKALKWACENLQNCLHNLTFEELKTKMIEHFANPQQTDMMLSRFLTNPPPESYSDYFTFLGDATTIYAKRFMNIRPLTQIVISKSPIELKTLLFSAAEENTTWDGFVTRAKQIAWVAFPDKALNVVSTNQSAARIHQRPTTQSVWCEYHESNTHSTKDCKVLQQLKKQKQSKNQKFTKKFGVKHIMGEEVEETETLEKQKDISDNNKHSFIYSVYPSHFHNPFFVRMSLDNKPITCLLDTGADMSIIPQSLIPKNATIWPHSIKALSAAGQSLKIIGRLYNLKIFKNNIEYSFDPYIVERIPNFIIIGADVLIKNETLINDAISTAKILKINVSHKSKANSIYNLQNSNEHTTQSAKFISEFADVFSEELYKADCCTVGSHSIDLQPNTSPIFKRNTRVPVNFESEIDNEVKKLLKLEIIVPSKSPWASQIVPVRKKDGSLRTCIDFRPLNTHTIKDRYPLPRIQEILDKLRNARIFSLLDATSGYYQIALSQDAREKTAFNWKGGHYEFTKMPFGLCNAPATFQRCMDKIFSDEASNHVIAYLDDIIVFSKTLDQHKQDLKDVFQKLKLHNIKLNKKKCKLFNTEVTILGHVISDGKIMTDPSKVDAIQKCPSPTTIRELRSFLGMANYSREFIPRYAEIAAPLYNLLKGRSVKSNATITKNNQTEKAFTTIKSALLKHCVRYQPDFTKPFHLTTDASDTAIGAVLSQVTVDGKRVMISAYSKTLDKHQLNYSTTDKELLGVIKGLENYRHYLLGKRFFLQTDHKSLTHLQQTKNQCSRLFRWSLKLQDYDMELVYVKGEDNVADCYSRIATITQQKKYLYIDDEETRHKILQNYHIIGGHASVQTMKFLILKKYRWEGAAKDIENFINKCSICLKEGNARACNKYRAIISQSPNDLWEIDLIGRIPVQNKNYYIIVAQNHFHKWIESKTISQKTPNTIIKFIHEQIIEKHGAPKSIITDMGKEFDNQYVKAFAQKNNINWNFASPGHHQTIGGVERMNQTLWKKIKKLCDYGKVPWTKVVADATFACNISFNRSLGNSPYVVRNMSAPVLAIDEKLKAPNKMYRAVDIEEKLKKVKRKYIKEIEKGKKKLEPNIKLNDPVLIYKKPNSDKLQAYWKQGFRVKEITPGGSFIVTKGKREYKINKRHLKKDVNES